MYRLFILFISLIIFTPPNDLKQKKEKWLHVYSTKFCDGYSDGYSDGHYDGQMDTHPLAEICVHNLARPHCLFLCLKQNKKGEQNCREGIVHLLSAYSQGLRYVTDYCTAHTRCTPHKQPLQMRSATRERERERENRRNLIYALITWARHYTRSTRNFDINGQPHQYS